MYLLGRLGRDPELKFTHSGQAVASFPPTVCFAHYLDILGLSSPRVLSVLNIPQKDKTASL